MQIRDGRLVVSPSDLSTFLICARKTSLDFGVALAMLEKPTWESPLGAVLAKRGLAHERAYVDELRRQGKNIVDLTGQKDATATEAAMRSGAEVIVQAPLCRDGWIGYADVLRLVHMPSALGDWSYEVEDTKLTTETKSGTVLQLCVYSEIIGAMQGRMPESFHVVTPANRQSFRIDDYSAYYRLVKRRFAEALDQAIGAPPPAWNEPTDAVPPVAHCELCRWWQRCDKERRTVDHLSFVASITGLNTKELGTRDVATMARLGREPRPLTWMPDRSSKTTYERLSHQAELQVLQRETKLPQLHRLTIEPDMGLCRLPEPNTGDLFIDLEGDPFGRTGAGLKVGDGTREYLFGLGRMVNGTWTYVHRWAWNDGEEKAALEWVMDVIAAAVADTPDAHIYHFGAYEASAFKRLTSRYATREPELDALLRAGRFVDLYGVTRQAVRCGVESYSIKALEQFYAFTRQIDLRDAGAKRQLIEFALETGDLSTIDDGVRAVVVGYNEDDCRSTLQLRDWLEGVRAEAIASGEAIARPGVKETEESKATEADKKAAELRARLLEGVPEDRAARTDDQQARWLMAFLIEWHRREERVAWGEYHRLREKPVEELEQETGAIVGLRFVERLQAPGGKVKTAIDRYTFDRQPVEIRDGDQLKLPDDSSIGSVAAIDRDLGTIDIKKMVKTIDVHPSVVIELSIIGGKAMKDSLFREGERIAAVGFDDEASDRLVADVLLARTPRLTSGPFTCPTTDVTEAVVKMSLALDGTVLPIQGPPGSGKTYLGARMIREFVKAGKKVGIVANSHKVIANLLEDVLTQAESAGESVRAGQKGDEGDALAPGASRFKDAKEIAAAFANGEIDVVGGTAWLWADDRLHKTVEVLFVDEAGQMALANVVAVAPAARNLVLLGDPQQLEQPKKGSHPDGCDVSALDHLLKGAAVVPSDRGVLLPITWRMAPKVTAFTSPTFYAGRLSSRPGLERQVLSGTKGLDGAGLWVVTVEHEGNQNFSVEEVDAVDALVSRLIGGQWTNADGERRSLVASDVLVVAPYNAQVNRLTERLQPRGVSVGTVDKFQGQEAPVVIYSMTSSSADDAPRGMEFLFSRNRLNVATSRARCAAIIVASPKLFCPDCKSPKQMLLANGLCRFREMAGTLAL